jgi:hypothetical protein
MLKKDKKMIINKKFQNIVTTLMLGSFLFCQGIFAYADSLSSLRVLSFDERDGAGVDNELDEAIFPDGGRFRRVPLRELDERTAETGAALSIEKSVATLIGELEGIIADYRASQPGTPQQQDALDRAEALVGKLRNLYSQIRGDRQPHANYRARLADLQKRRESIYRRIKAADERGDRNALKRLNLEAVGVNRLITRYRIIAAGRILSGQSGHTSFVPAATSALWALRGALNSTRALKAELQYRTQRLHAVRATKAHQAATVDWLNELVQTFGFKGFDIKVIPAQVPGEASQVSIRQQRWIEVHTSLREIRDYIRRGRINWALEKINLLIDLYRTQYDLASKTYRDIYNRLDALRQLASALQEGQIPPQAVLNQIGISGRPGMIDRLIQSISHPKESIWMDIAYKDLAAGFRSQFHTIETYEPEITRIRSSRADLEYYADLLNTAVERDRLSIRNKRIISNGLGRLAEWTERGFVHPKQFGLIHLQAATPLVDRDDFKNAEKELRAAIAQLDARLEDIDRIIENVRKRGTALFGRYRDEDINTRINAITTAISSRDFDGALVQITELRELYFNGELVEPGYIRAEHLLRQVTNAIRGAQRLRTSQPRILQSTIQGVQIRLAQVREDASTQHKNSYRIPVTMPDGTPRQVFIKPGVTTKGLLGILRVQNPETIAVTISGRGTLSQQGLDVSLRDGAAVTLARKRTGQPRAAAPQQPRPMLNLKAVLRAI